MRDAVPKMDPPDPERVYRNYLRTVPAPGRHANAPRSGESVDPGMG